MEDTSRPLGSSARVAIYLAGHAARAAGVSAARHPEIGVRRHQFKMTRMYRKYFASPDESYQTKSERASVLASRPANLRDFPQDYIPSTLSERFDREAFVQV